ncbi:MAG: GBS Bsp-like repeat-containing protein [Thomasclavelia ramosa]
MKKKMIKISAVSLITLSMTMGNVTAINSVNNEENNELGKQNNFSQTSDESFSNESENSESNTEDVQKKNKSIIGQTKFVDENGNIKAVDVYDGTTGEVYNPKMRVVNTANMVNFNCSSAETTTKFVDYYTGQEGYISKASAADAAFLGIENGKVKFMIAGVVGLVDPSLVEIVNQGTYYASNYEVNSKGKLYHYISNDVTATGNQGNFNYVGEGPSYLAKGKEYYSYDGHYFYSNYEVMINDYKKNTRTNAVNPNNPYYNYFQYLPMRSKTNYNAAQLSKYLNTKANSSTSKLNDTGDIFIKYQNTYGVNALMAASFAALESGWGKSSIAQNKNNLFGLNAVDSNPSIAADTFESVDSCIKDFTSNWMSKRYLNANYTSLFRGGYFGDKGSGIFGKYSSDPYEGEKCASIAENMDAGIAGQDKNYYTIGIKDASLISNTKIDVKQFSNTNSITFYTTISNPAYAFIIRNKTLNNGYYEIQSDSSLNDNRTEISSSGIYNFDNNYAYIKENSISIINMGNDISSSKKEPPKISDVKVSNVTRAGYTVTCTVTDDVEVAKVEFPTWTLKGDQDDLTWEKGEIKGNQVTYTVRSKDHNNEGGTYRTHIYAYDNEGNVTTYAVTPDTVLPANQPPKISDVKVSNVTRAGYTVTCTVTDDVEVAKVEFPTWTLKGDQDDLTWEKGEIKGNQVTYTVRSKDHNNEGGTYRTHIYAYDNEGNVTTYAVTPDTVLPANQPPKISDVKVSNVTRAGYTVTCTVTDDVEVAKVEFPTWTLKGDQDDLTWEKGEIKGNQVTYTVRSKDHNNEGGTYRTHIYAYDNEGNVTTYAVTPDTVLPANQPPKISDVKVSNVTRAGYTVTCTVTDDVEVAKVEFPTWTLKGDQDDLTWEKGEIKGNQVTYTVRSKDHNNEGGTYRTHIYAYDNEGNVTTYAVTPDTVLPANQPPKISDVKVSNVTRAGYTVTCTVTDDVEVAKVEFPTWTLKGDQDDLTWEKGEIKGNQVTYTVRSKDHNNEGGTYRTHIYAYDNEGNVTTYAVTPDTVLPANQPPKISDVKVSNVTRAGYTVTCTVTDDVEVAKVEFPTWTLKGDQDDLTWEKGEIKGNQVTYTVRSKDHNNEGGTYRTHIYAYDNEGNVTTYAVEDVELDINEYIDDYPLIHDVYVKDLNDEGYTITAKVKTNSEISKVEFPTWTIHNDQDDLEWKNGTILGDTISVRINRKDHNYEYGVYKTHIYVYTKDGKSSAIAVNPISLKNTQNYKGWYYNNGQKYFYNNNGEMVGNGPAKKVIDVSLYNGDIDWDTVKKYGDIDGAILRIAAHPNGSYIEDKKFYDNLMACRRLDIPFGVYIYDYAQTPDDAMFEASFVINTLKKYGVTPSEMSFPIYYDLERNSITTELYVQFVSAFTSRISEAGYFANVYSYRALLNTNLNDPYILEKTSWVAAYSNAIGFNNPYYSGEKGWQYTSSGSIPGIDGDVDISVWYND